MNSEGSKSTLISPLPSNNSTMLGDIKTGTPLDLTIDNSVLHQQEQEFMGQGLQQQESQIQHQNFEDMRQGHTNESSNIESIQSIELIQPEDQALVLEAPRNEDVEVVVIKDGDVKVEGVEEGVEEGEEGEEEEDPIDKMRSIEILPDLFNLLYELNNSSNTKVTAKDFDKYLGSLRLKLGNIKNSMQQIDNINETLVNTFDKIEKLEQNNNNKQNFLLQLKQKVDQSL